MSDDTKHKHGVGHLLGKYWFPIVLLIVFAIFIFSNGDSTNVSFLAWGWSTPLWLALLATLAAGWVIGFFSGRHHYKGD